VRTILHHFLFQARYFSILLLLFVIPLFSFYYFLELPVKKVFVGPLLLLIIYNFVIFNEKTFRRKAKETAKLKPMVGKGRVPSHGDIEKQVNSYVFGRHTTWVSIGLMILGLAYYYGDL
jgi:Ca2+/Na+ antiporter